MTPIPGTNDIKSHHKTEKAKPQVQDKPEIIGIYRKEIKVQNKLESKPKMWYLEIKYWNRAALASLLIFTILGFVIYKSFFILAVFVPTSLYAIWYVIRVFEDSISKLDTLNNK